MDTGDAIRAEIGRLRGPDHETAWFNLIEAPASVIPQIIEAYRSEKDAGFRAVLVQIVWQRRDPGTLDFLAEALRDLDDRVWKEALDGIVAIGGPAAVAILKTARAKAELERSGDEDFFEWLDEASDQIRNGSFPDS